MIHTGESSGGDSIGRKWPRYGFFGKEEVSPGCGERLMLRSWRPYDILKD
jgi:hypothetical protein